MLKNIFSLLNLAFEDWLFSLLLIPLYQLLLYQCFHSCSSSMLQCIGAGLFICALGHILLSALGVVGVIVSDDVQRYLSCTALAPNATNPGDYAEWYRTYITNNSLALYTHTFNEALPAHVRC